MVNDIAAVSPMNNLLAKYADDITIKVSIRQSTDTAAVEVENMKKWADTKEIFSILPKHGKCACTAKLLSYTLQNYQE